MAKQGRGAVAYLGPQDSADEIMDGFFARVSHPALTDVRIDWGAMAVTDVYPAKLPDLFVGRPVVVTGKYHGTPGDVGVSGVAGTVGHGFEIAAGDADDDNAYLPKIWARLRIAELADRQTWSDDPNRELERAIRQTALEYQLMSDYTSFVAVDTSRRTEGTRGTTVHQAVPVPAASGKACWTRTPAPGSRSRSLRNGTTPTTASSSTHRRGSDASAGSAGACGNGADRKRPATAPSRW